LGVNRSLWPNVERALRDTCRVGRNGGETLVVAEDASGPNETAYAGWGRRFMGWLIDILLVYVLPIVLLFVGFAAGGSEFEDDGAGAAVLYIAIPLLVLVIPLYFGLFHAGRRGQTIGKRVTGIAVRRIDGTRLSKGAAFGRAGFVFLLYIAGGVGVLVDGLWPLFDKTNQALHDKVVNSVVVKVEKAQ
jgi:uncharacterized RDD family membrane protein YckC